MNKKLLLLAVLVAVSPVVQVVASAESMYKDLVETVIAPDGRLNAAKLNKLDDVRWHLKHEQRNLQDEVTRRYAKRYPNADELGCMGLVGVVGTTCGLLSCYEYCTLKPYHTGQRLCSALMLTSYCFGCIICVAVANFVQIKLCTKKIREIAAVFTKLDALEAQLKSELDLFAAQGIAIEQER